MTILYVLVGVPGSGKSTWTGHQSFDWEKTVIVSTDRFVTRHALEVGKSYREVFDDYMPTAVRLMAEQARDAFESNKIVVWDQTSTTVLSRAKKLRMCPDHYTKIAVVLETPKAELHPKFLDRPDKEIPWEVVQGMIDNFEMPTKDEGFDKIIKTKMRGVEE
jgi:predicted kinase